jgi:hypothetical protein
MNTMSWAARPAVRFAGLAAGLALLLGACGEQVPEGTEPPATTGSLTAPAATHQMAALSTEITAVR